MAASIIESARNLMPRAPRQQQLTAEEALDKKRNRPECHLNLKRVAKLWLFCALRAAWLLCTLIARARFLRCE